MSAAAARLEGWLSVASARHQGPGSRWLVVTVEDAVEQYQRDRDSRELLFEFDRCIAHFVVDDASVRFTTRLRDKDSWFLPFDKGWNDGAGNPPIDDDIKTDYLWKRILTPQGLTDILENYAQLFDEKDLRTGKTTRKQIFPRYHQLDVVRQLLADAQKRGSGAPLALGPARRRSLHHTVCDGLEAPRGGKIGV